MARTPIPPRVIDFIIEKIDTVAELESLLILGDDEQRLWTVHELAARLYTQPSIASRVLESLSRRELVAAERATSQFRFSPKRSDDREAFAEVAEAYRRNLVAITTLIHSKASSSVKEFARAFDLKKDH